MTQTNRYPEEILNCLCVKFTNFSCHRFFPFYSIVFSHGFRIIFVYKCPSLKIEHLVYVFRGYLVCILLSFYFKYAQGSNNLFSEYTHDANWSKLTRSDFEKYFLGKFTTTALQICYWKKTKFLRKITCWQFTVAPG